MKSFAPNKLFFTSENAAVFVGYSLRQFHRMADKFGTYRFTVEGRHHHMQFWLRPDLERLRRSVQCLKVAA